MANNHSILITGAAPDERKQTALEISREQSGNFDTIIIDTLEEKGIAAVRTIIEKVAVRPFQSGLTSVIILEADNLTLEAQNALLKLLEEPPEHAQIILTAQSASTLLPTVVSRCFTQDLKTKQVETEEINIEDLFSLSWGERLEAIEKLDLTTYLKGWHNFLQRGDTNVKKVSIKKVWSYTKLIVKLRKGSKTAANKKLLSLILALEFPT